MSAQTKSFVSLIALAALLSGLVFLFSKKSEQAPTQTGVQSQQDQNTTAVLEKNPEPPPTDVANWQEYKDEELDLSFKHPKGWAVSTAKATDPDYDIIVIDPGPEQDHLRIYSGSENYFAADGLEKENARIAGREGWTVEQMLYGIKAGSRYFTFDLGTNVRLKPTFVALMSTVSFDN